MLENESGLPDVTDRPLAGLTVIDLSQVLAGPLCTMILGDLGADVIKVEPSQGDQARQSLGTRIGDDSAAFLAVNRNKRSIVLDLQTSVGRGTLHRLVASADIVVENFRPGVAERLGAGYDELSELNPRLVYGSLTGFGSRGPYAERAGLDLVVQAMTGLMSVTGEAGRPVKNGPPVADLSAGLYLTIGILAALESRRKTGRGQLVTTSLYESALSLGVWETAELWANGQTPGPLGSAHRMAAPYQALRTMDGYVVVAATNDRLWLRLCDLVELPDLADDPRFLTNADRLEHKQEPGRRARGSTGAPDDGRVGPRARRCGGARRPAVRLCADARRPTHRSDRDDRGEQASDGWKVQDAWLADAPGRQHIRGPKAAPAVGRAHRRGPGVDGFRRR